MVYQRQSPSGLRGNAMFAQPVCNLRCDRLGGAEYSPDPPVRLIDFAMWHQSAGVAHLYPLRRHQLLHSIITWLCENFAALSASHRHMQIMVFHKVLNHYHFGFG